MKTKEQDFALQTEITKIWRQENCVITILGWEICMIKYVLNIYGNVSKDIWKCSKQQDIWIR